MAYANPYYSVIESVRQRLEAEFGLRPVMAAELEFYLPGAADKWGENGALEQLALACRMANIPVAAVTKEEGPDQYEVALPATGMPLELVNRLAGLVVLAEQHFGPRGVRPDFSAKLRGDLPGSGLHIHLHLIDNAGRNVFTREGDEMEDEFSPALRQVIGGLLATMQECMVLFAPLEESYRRFVPKSNTPTTVSWGTNNRTVAVRLPTKAIDNKHLEHRVAGADADPGCVVAAVLAGTHYGLLHKPALQDATYGDASLPQYALPKLLNELAKAREFHRAGERIRPYFAAGLPI